MTPERIIEIRDACLPSQGEALDCVAFALAIEREARYDALTEAMQAVSPYILLGVGMNGSHLAAAICDALAEARDGERTEAGG